GRLGRFGRSPPPMLRGGRFPPLPLPGRSPRPGRSGRFPPPMLGGRFPPPAEGRPIPPPGVGRDSGVRLGLDARAPPSRDPSGPPTEGVGLESDRRFPPPSRRAPRSMRCESAKPGTSKPDARSAHSVSFLMAHLSYLLTALRTKFASTSSIG